jgi:hypothetical protein
MGLLLELKACPGLFDTTTPVGSGITVTLYVFYDYA